MLSFALDMHDVRDCHRQVSPAQSCIYPLLTDKHIAPASSPSLAKLLHLSSARLFSPILSSAQLSFSYVPRCSFREASDCLTRHRTQVYNAGFDEALARPAKVHLVQCMNALREMEVRFLLILLRRTPGTQGPIRF